VPEENRPKSGTTATPAHVVAAKHDPVEESKIPLSRYKAAFGAEK